MLSAKKLILFQVIIGATILFSGCELVNPSEQVPSYIQIEDITVDEDNSQVTDAWVYVDGYLVGAYSLPAHFPVLASGDVRVTVRSGIRVNGIAVTRGFYSFYDEWETETTLKEGETTILTPTTQYKSGLTFQLDEDFESFVVDFEPVDTTGISFVKSDTVSDAPTKVGIIQMGTDTIFQVQTIEQFDLPVYGDVFMELSFKTDISFELAWQVDNSVTSAIAINSLYQFSPTDEWQHIYIYLSSFISEYSSPNNRFRFIFRSANFQAETKYIYIDNIKLIHF
jgi:hypothetical protein